MAPLNATHDPALRSWVESANAAGTDFPIQNLPFGVFATGPDQAPRCGVAIGDRVLDVTAVAHHFTGAARVAAGACAEPVLNPLMALQPGVVSALRAQLSAALAAGPGGAQPPHAQEWRAALHPMDAVDMRLPMRVGGFTDFFASIHHATNAGRLFRPDQPLLPNYKYVPIAYNGRANSVRVSGEPVRRPLGQLRGATPADPPRFAPSARLDHEVELGFVVGPASRTGEPVPVARGWQHVFGCCLLNDWSARDIQAWEYQPLGPFLAKSFATSISPWIVTAEALAPFRMPLAARPEGDPAPLPHLSDADDQRQGAVSIRIAASLRTRRMRERDLPARRLSLSDTASLYWTPAQMVAHHTSNGCALDTGDLLGSGTVSGPTPDALGCLLEITQGGAQPVELPGGESRHFLADGDELVLSGWCERPGHARIGFGECRAVVLPAAGLDADGEAA